MTRKLTCPQDEKNHEEGAAPAEDVAGASAPATQVEALKDVTNEATADREGKHGKAQPRAAREPREPRERRERGPPADGIPSKTKVMVANLPYDLTEEQVCEPHTVLACHRH